MNFRFVLFCLVFNCKISFLFKIIRSSWSTQTPAGCSFKLEMPGMLSEVPEFFCFVTAVTFFLFLSFSVPLLFSCCPLSHLPHPLAALLTTPWLMRRDVSSAETARSCRSFARTTRRQINETECSSCGK